MAKNRTITNYFTASTSASSSARKDDPPSRSSSLSPCPSYLSQPFSSPLVTRATRTLNEHSTQSSVSDNVSLDYDAKRPDPSQRTSLGASFGSSQRVVKDGQVIVTGTDGEDNDSISGDDLLRQFLGTTSRSSPTRRKAASKIPTTPSKYKFSLDDLVMDAVDDREAEANISKLNLAFKSPRADSEAAKANRTPKQRSRMFRDDILASVIGEDTSIGKMQRLKDAVDRTEALDQGKSWSFFADTVASVAPPRFPEKSVPPGSWESVLRGPITRERAFLSGLIGESLSGNTLPDEVLLWTFQACTSEPKDEVRFAYCSAIKVAPANRISSLVHSTQIEQMFRNLGARPDALSVEDVIIPDFRGLDRSKSRDHKYLLSALDLIDGLASKLNNEARDRALKIALRLTLDEACMHDYLLSAAAQRAITSLLEKPDVPLADYALYELSVILFNTIQDVALRSQLLKHICPVTPKIALFRCRLSSAFFFEDKTFLDKPMQLIFDLRRMTRRLQDNRFKMNRSTSKGWEPYDYWELTAITSILDVAIDTGTMEKSFLKKEDEVKFNQDVDKLADQIKAIFTAIQDTGASHLKRTEAKEFLQALHYRLIYSVRTKPRPKVSWFVSSKRGGENWSGIKKSENLMERFLACGQNDHSDGDEDLSSPATDI